jgi:thiamine biosynthesis protein ThiI
MEKIDSILVRYNEIGLKGKNRSYFEKRLIKNIKDCLNKNKINFSSITRYAGRILISTNDKCLSLKNVFGISSFSPAIKLDLDLNKIKEEALKLYTKGSFRISAKRLNKKFNYTSEQLNKELGEYISKNKKAKVNLVKPDCNIAVEIMDYAYLFNERYECLGGLPVSIEGLVTLILDTKDALLAGILMMKRGCNLEIIKEKDISYDILEKYSYGSKINIVKEPSKESKSVIKVEKLENIKSKLYNLPIFNPLITNEESFY